MEKPLYISDLDGTLLNRNGELSNYSYSVIHELLQDGIPFTVASARSLHTMKRILGDLPFQLPVICMNGAYICDFSEHRYLVVNDLPYSIKSGVLDYFKLNGLGAFISAFIDQQECLFHYRLNNPGQLWYLEDRQRAKDRRLKESNTLEPHYDQQVVSFTLMESESTLRQVQSDLKQTFGDQLNLNLTENLYLPGSWWLTIHHGKANKAQGIQYLLDQGLAHAKHLTVFGDELNDQKMFELSSHAIAVSNAHPHIRDLADTVIESNEHNSVARYLLKAWNGKK